jgi:hypothetical protein
MDLHSPTPRRCRRCDSASVFLTRPCDTFERLLWYVLIHPYRCHRCDKRIWRFSRRTQLVLRWAGAAVLLAGVLLLVVGVVLWLTASPLLG